MAEKKNYIDLKLYLSRPAGDAQACQVALLPTPEVGETIEPVTVGADKGPPSELLPQITTKTITIRKLAEYGRGLANWMLPEGTIRELFQEAYKRAGNSGGVRLRLIIADQSLKELPWEYVYLQLLPGPDSFKGFLALDPRVSIVRHEPLPRPHPASSKLAADFSDLKMVLASASPEASDQGLQPLNVDKEVGYIQEAIKGFDLEGVHLTADPILKDVTQEDLRQALLQNAYIFHFAGHGVPKAMRDSLARDAAKEDVYLLLSQEGDKNKVDYMGASELAGLLQKADTKLAVLGACYSGRRYERYPWDGVAGALAAAEIPAIICMQFEVIDTNAIEFSRAFYAALGLGLSLDEAMWIGRSAMLNSTEYDDGGVNLEWGVPVLYSRLSDGALFPERMEEATDAAEAFKYAVSQSISGIMAGTMTGVKVGMLDDGLEVVQEVKTITGSATGAVVNETGSGAKIVIRQVVGEVGEGGVLTGLVIP